jgi:uncharacterized Tic20 family protein
LAGNVFSFITALLVWLLKKESNAYLADQAKEAINLQITVAISIFVCGSILSWVLIGLMMLPMVLLANIVFCIIAAIATIKGETYRYPLCLRLIN